MKIKRVTTSFRTFGKGPSGLNEGDLVPDTHPLVKKAPQNFEDVSDYVKRRYPDMIEEATAAPGEKRSMRRSKPAKPIEPEQQQESEGEATSGETDDK